MKQEMQHFQSFEDSVVIMASEEEVLLAAAACVIISTHRQPTERRWWVRPSLEARHRYSGTHLMEDLMEDGRDPLSGEIRDDGSFRNFARMSSSDFEYLLINVAPTIAKQDTNYRWAIPARERLAVTLRFLASGDSYQSLSYLFKISKQSISKIVPEVCRALIVFLKDVIKVCISIIIFKQIFYYANFNIYYANLYTITFNNAK